jgi:predicted  nucleic acid-binding Zn-ribbon protein
MSKKLTTEQFIEKSIKIHGTKYCYNKVIYIDKPSKVEIICNTCKTSFFQTPHQHLYARSGCSKCASIAANAKKTKSHESFVQEANNIHNNQYEYLTPYVNAKTKIQIRHRKCGNIFSQSPNAHLSHKRGCPRCGITKRASLLRKTTEEFIEQANKIHNSEYEYLSEYKGDAYKIMMKHKNCGHIFMQKISTHLQGSGCPECASSRAEKIMKRCLEENHVDFIYQHKFSDCINPTTNKQLIFDFYLQKHNTIFELDGPQHLRPFRFLGMTTEQAEQEFIKCKFRDEIKNQYCKEKNIDLIRINFIWDKKFQEKITQILLEIIS